MVSPGHLSTVESRWNEDNGFEAYGVSYKGVLMSGLQPNLPHAEYERRRIEIQEEDRIEDFYRRGELNSNTAILTVSPFPDDMSTTEAKSLGYDPGERRYFLRWHEVNDLGERKTKSLSMEGSDTSLLSQVVTTLNDMPHSARLTSSEILSTQVVVNKDEVDDIHTVAEMIDDLSGGTSFGKFEKTRPDYKNLESLSNKREALASAEIETFTQNLIDLAKKSLEENGPSVEEALTKYRELALNTILLVAMDQPDIAERTVGKAAAQKLKKAKQQISRGNYSSAMATVETAASVATPMYMCGMEINSGSRGSGSEGGFTSLLEMFSSKEKTLKCVKCPLKGCGKMVDAKMKIANGKKTISCPACRRSRSYKA